MLYNSTSCSSIATTSICGRSCSSDICRTSTGSSVSSCSIIIIVVVVPVVVTLSVVLF